MTCKRVVHAKSRITAYLRLKMYLRFEFLCNFLFRNVLTSNYYFCSEYLTYFEDGEEKPSTPPRHTTFIQDERAPAAEHSSSKKRSKKNPKALPKIRGAQPKK